MNPLASLTLFALGIALLILGFSSAELLGPQLARLFTGQLDRLDPLARTSAAGSAWRPDFGRRSGARVPPAGLPAIRN